MILEMNDKGEEVCDNCAGRKYTIEGDERVPCDCQMGADDDELVEME